MDVWQRHESGAQVEIGGSGAHALERRSGADDVACTWPRAQDPGAGDPVTARAVASIQFSAQFHAFAGRLGGWPDDPGLRLRQCERSADESGKRGCEWDKSAAAHD